MVDQFLLEIILPLGVLAGISAGVLRLKQRAEHPLPWWWAGWCALVAALFCAELDLQLGSFHLALVFSPFFAVLMLAGALRMASRPVPGWLLIAGGAFGLLRAGLAAAGFPWMPHVLSLGVEMPVLALAAVVAYRAREGGVKARRLIPFGLALVLVPRGLDAWNDLTVAPLSPPFWPWFVASLPLVSLQVIDAIESSRRAHASVSNALAENLRRFQAIADSAYDLISEIDSRGFIHYASPNWKALLGFDPEEVVGQNAFELIHPEDLESTNVGMPYEIGTHRPVPPFRLRRKGGSYRWFEGTVCRYQTSEGKNRLVVMSRDITDRIRLEERIRDTQKLESLGLLAGGVAHDFNNLLVPILTNAGTALARLPSDSDLVPVLEDVAKGAQRAADLAHQLLAYAGRRHRNETILDLSELTSNTAQLLETRLHPGINVIKKLPPDLPPVLGDASQLRQIVMNLITNSADAIGERRGTIALRTDVMVADEAYLARTELRDLEPGTFVYLEVSDDGQGMDDVSRARIFDPFFTTKSAGRGLGLAVLMGIIRSHNGTIHVESSPGFGTTIRVLFRAREGAAYSPTPRPPSNAPRGSGSVLVVDDEEAVRIAAARALEYAGYDVMEARNGREAIELLNASSETPIAVLMDVTMPEMSGDIAYLALRQTHPTLPVILSSGFAEQDLAGRLPTDPHVAFLEKPYETQALTTLVASLVDAPADRDPRA